MRTPVLFIIFNRLNTTRRVFEAIRRNRPEYLYIAADGPRIGVASDREQCKEVREWVLNHIDWECEIQTRFLAENIGCKLGPSEAIHWFFQEVEAGIILEDDCLPNNSFFRFCEENLERYRDDDRISIVSGNNFQPIQPMSITADYYFSIFPSTWGWATWKRTWENYDIDIRGWHSIDQTKFLNSLFREKSYRNYWKQTFTDYATGKGAATWDFQFYFHTMRKGQLAIIPKANLVSNIGHGELATHTTVKDSILADLPTYEIRFPLNHPEEIVRNYDADILVQKIIFGEVTDVPFLKKIKRMVRHMIRLKKR